MLEERIAEFEVGATSFAVASGASVIHYAIITIAGQGDEIVSANNLYGGTYTMFNSIFREV